MWEWGDGDVGEVGKAAATGNFVTERPSQETLYKFSLAIA